MRELNKERGKLNGQPESKHDMEERGGQTWKKRFPKCCANSLEPEKVWDGCPFEGCSAPRR